MKKPAMCLFGTALMILFLLLSGCPTDPPAGVVYGWSSMGETPFTPGNASHMSLEILDGKPVLAFRDSESNIHKASVMAWDSSAGDWTLVGDQHFSEHTATDVSLQMVNGNPLIAYRDVEDMTTNSGRVMSYNGVTWTRIGDEFCGGTGVLENNYSTVSFQMIGNTPCVAYAEDEVNSYVRVKTFSSGSWENLPGTLSVVVTDLSLKAVSASEVYLAYVREENNKIAVRVNDGMGWTVLGETTGFTDGEAAYISLDVYNGTPYVAFRDEANSDEITVMYWDGTAWTALGTPGFTSGTGAVASINLKVLNQNRAYVSYSRGGGSVYVEKWNGTSWSSVGGGRINDTDTQASNPVLQEHEGELFVAYQTTVFENATPVDYGATVKRWGEL